MFRGYRYRLSPTPEQESKLRQFAGVCRLIYNAALEQRSVYWRQFKAVTGSNISFASQCRELTALRAEVPWIAEVPRAAAEQALRDLDAAFAKFFRLGSGYPRPRRRGEYDAFRVTSESVNFTRLNDKWSTTTLPKIGRVKYRNTRPMRGRLLSVTVRLVGDSWFATFGCEIEEAHPTETILPTVGIDRGVANTITLSTGAQASLPPSLLAIEIRQRRAKRSLARKRRGSARHARQRRRVAAMSRRCARIRLDWQHRAALNLARSFGCVVLEDLNVAGMTARGRRKGGLNRAILNQGWSSFETILSYKLEERGGSLVKVPAPYTSQTCSSCGTIDRESRESQATFRCRHCGFEAHADVNAAINILGRNTAPVRVEAREGPAVEARTMSRRKLVKNHSALAA